jgi:PadR family transcriptional regulator, regulatory protein PadR
MGKHTNDRLQGTIDLLILKALARSGPLHGYALAQAIRQWSDEMLQIEDGSLYPALHRMTEEKWLKPSWGLTDTNRKARFYAITATGRKQLEQEEKNWAHLTDAVGRVLRFV